MSGGRRGDGEEGFTALALQVIHSEGRRVNRAVGGLTEKRGEWWGKKASPEAN